MFKAKKTPVILQMSAADCGAACLAMIVGYWGRHISVAECQRVMGGGQNGVTALMITQAAGALGLTTDAYRYTPAGLATAVLPAIIHWQGVHFVVLEKWTTKKAIIIDPALGRLTLTHDQFVARYSGVTLTFTPNNTFAERMAAYTAEAPVATWRHYAQRALNVPGSRYLGGQLLATSLLLQLAGLILPIAIWLVVERIVPSNAEPPLLLLLIGIIVVLVAQTAIIYLRNLLIIRLQEKLDSHLMPDFLAHLLTLPYDFFQQRTSGDLISRLEGNAVVRQMIASGVLSGLIDGGLALFYLFILYAQSPLFGLVVTGIALTQFLLLASTGRRVHEYSQIALATHAEEDGFAVQVLRGIESVKAAGTEKWLFEQWHDRFTATLQADIRRDHYVAGINSLLHFLTNAAPLILLWLGVSAVNADQLSVGQMLGLVVLASSSLAPLGSLAHYINQVQQIWAYLERLADVWDAPTEKGAVTTVKHAPLRLQGSIQVSNLTFCYTQDGSFGLHDLSFSVSPGEKIGIVGPTGAGKSTLVRLLLGLYQPQAGCITFDGRSIEELGVARLRRAIGVVLQDSFIISGTIRENIALNQPDMLLSQVIDAAKQAALHEEIMRLPMRYETRVGEGGSGLSGGQRQRLTLARALAVRPSLLILDEATSHLDGISEGLVQQALDRLPITRLIIAHRLGSVQDADRILVLDGGRLVEEGTPGALAARDGVYRRLWQAAVRK
ncbi:MAG TPA: peptidase domain-containing ABC transporter [Anaerolineae bacterium]|nr:peptidase domain-containing ABC transporter [Anaerolineae bacterium]